MVVKKLYGQHPASKQDETLASKITDRMLRDHSFRDHTLTLRYSSCAIQNCAMPDGDDIQEVAIRDGVLVSPGGKQVIKLMDGTYLH